jgi:serine/threonine-protein kinase SRPK3
MPDQPGSGPSRYIRIARVEKLDNYRPGGFHPIRLGDTFKDGRYVVVNKLGYGGASTVWLAHDTYQQQAVALSIIMSEGPTGTVERQLDTLRHLSTGPEGHPGHDNVLPLLDEFTITGPNGTHTCFSTTIMGQSISVATKRAQGVATKVLRLNVAKEAVINLANAISYLTLMGVVHGGISSLVIPRS